MACNTVVPSKLMAHALDSGAMAIVHAASPSQPNQPPKPWSLLGLFPSETIGDPAAHSDIVRCFDWNAQTQKAVTGGEDGRVCIWSLGDSLVNAEDARTAAIRLDALPTPAATSAAANYNAALGKDRNSPLGAASRNRFKPYG